MAHHYDTYREELAKAYPGFGYALWEPDPGGQDRSVAIGDVGFIREGRFHRLFNALLPADHPSNEIFGVPAGHEPLLPSTPNHINRGALAPNTLYSYGVTVVSGGFGVLAATKVGSAEVSFSCTKKHGAVLSFPVTAKREDTVSQDHFRRWIIRHIDSWFTFTQMHGLGIEMEDIVLVTGTHHTRSWTNIAFSEVQTGAQLSLKVEVADALGANVHWGVSNVRIQGTVHNQGPSGKNLPENQCIFIRGYRVKRYFFGMIRPKAAAEPKSDPPRGDREPEKEVVSISDLTEYRDPLHVLLDYIAKRAAPDCDMVLVHDDDLEKILGASDRTSLETLQPGVVMNYLERSQPDIEVTSDSFPRTHQIPGAGMDHVWLATLSERLESLDETYKRVLKEIEEAKRSQAHRLLQFLTVAIRPLRVEELVEFLALDFDEAQGGIPVLKKDLKLNDPDQGVLTMCSGLIKIGQHRSKARVVDFAHSSVKEFMTSNRLAASDEDVSCFHISLSLAHTTVAKACLGMLLQLGNSLHSEIRSPLTEYAAQHWVNHAQSENAAFHVEDGMRRLFDPASPHFAAWLQLHDIDDGWNMFGDRSKMTEPRGTPLYYASLCGFRAVAAHLIAEHPQYVNTRGGRNRSPLVAALHKRHFDVAELLFKHGAVVDVRGNESQTPLHAASLEGLADVVEWLLTHGADANSEDGLSESTPLHWAASNGHLEVVRMLLEHGADVNAVNKDGCTPLHLASRFGHLDIMRLLLKEADTDAKVLSRLTTLRLNLSSGPAENVGLQTRGGADSIVWKDGHSRPLHLESPVGQAETIQPPIEHGMDVNARDKDNSTPLHLASSTGNAETVQLLLEHGADINAKDHDLSTPLHLASYSGSAELMQLLIDSGADIYAKDEGHSTPLHLASLLGNADAVQLLLEHGADVDARNTSKSTPLHIASSAGSAKAVRLLVDRGADLRAEDDRGRTPFQLVSGRHRRPGHAIVKQLLSEHRM